MKWSGDAGRRVIGVDVTPAAIVLAQSRPHAGASQHVERFAVLDRAAGGPVSEDEAARVMGVLARRGFVGRRLVLGLSGPNIAGEVISLPAITSKAPLHALACAELARLRRWDEQTMECAWWTLPASAPAPVGGAAASGGPSASAGTSAMCIGAQHAHIEPMLAPWLAAGADVVAVDARSLAMWRSAVPSLPSARGVLSMILDVRRDGATILVFAGRTLVYERSLADLAMSRAIALAGERLGVAPAVVHELWTCANASAIPAALGGSAVLDVLRDCATTTVRSLAEEARVSGAYASGRFSATLGEGSVVLICGDAATLPGLADLLAAEGLAGVRLVEGQPSLLAARGLSIWCPPTHASRARGAA